jgi:hypothetical protein
MTLGEDQARFEKTREEARAATFAGLNGYIRLLPHEDDSQRKALGGLRDSLFATDTSINIVLRVLIAHDATFAMNGRPQLYSLTSLTFRALLASLAMPQLVHSYIQEVGAETVGEAERVEKMEVAATLFRVKACAIGHMYARKQEYVDMWISHLPSFVAMPDANERFERIARESFNESALILGLQNNAEIAQVFLWYTIQMVGTQVGLLAYPGLRALADRALGPLVFQ